MNQLTQHLTNICKRHGVKNTASTMLSFLQDMSDEHIINAINNDKFLNISLQYGLITVDNEKEIPGGLTLVVKDYDVEPSPDAILEEDINGPYFMRTYRRAE